MSSPRIDVRALHLKEDSVAVPSVTLVLPENKTATHKTPSTSKVDLLHDINDNALVVKYFGQLSKRDLREFVTEFKKSPAQLAKIIHDDSFWHYIRLIENYGANSTNLLYFWFAWMTGATGFLALMKTVNPDSNISESTAQIVGGIFSILNCLQFMVVFSPGKEAIRTTLESAFTAPKTQRIQEWGRYFCQKPHLALLELTSSLITQTIQYVSNLNAGVSVPLGIYSYLQKLPWDGAYFTIPLTYLGGVVFYRNYMDKDFREFINFVRNTENHPYTLKKLFKKLCRLEFAGALKELNVLLEGSIAPLIRGLIVYKYIAISALEAFNGRWFPYQLVMGTSLAQSGVFYKLTYDNYNEDESRLRNLLSDPNNVRRLSRSDRINPTPEQLALVTRFINNSTPELQEEIAESFKNLLIKSATENASFGYVWRKNWQVIITDLFAMLVGGWAGNVLARATLEAVMGSTGSSAFGIALGGFTVPLVFHQPERTKVNEAEACKLAKEILPTEPDEENPTEATDNDEVNPEINCKTVFKIAVIAALVMGLLGSTVMSENGMLDTSTAFLMASAAIAIMKCTLSNVRYNAQKLYNCVTNFRLSCTPVRVTQSRDTFFQQDVSKDNRNPTRVVSPTAPGLSAQP